jgi:hypothetical protein
MFGIKTKTETKKPEALVAAIRELFGEDAKVEGFDLEAAIKRTIALSKLSTDAAKAFGSKADDEEFDFVASVKKAVTQAGAAKVATTTLLEVKSLFGEDAKAEGFDLKTAVQEKIDRVAEMEAMDGEEETKPPKGPVSEASKTLKEFYSETDAEIDRMIASQKK